MKFVAGLLVSAAVLGFSSAATADDWGCEVLLCLANPDGPMALKECEPPIRRLFAALSKRKPDRFPSCESANGAAVAQQGFNYYDACPAGTSALPSGQQAAQLSKSAYAALAASRNAQLAQEAVVVGIGEGDGEIAFPGFGKRNQQAKVCVARPLGIVGGADRDEPSSPVTVYEQVTTLQKNASPRYIDVLIDNKPFTRVRF